MNNGKRAPCCSFRMPVRARRPAPTSHRYFLFFFFFLTQGAFLLPDMDCFGTVVLIYPCFLQFAFILNCFLSGSPVIWGKSTRMRNWWTDLGSTRTYWTSTWRTSTVWDEEAKAKGDQGLDPVLRGQDPGDLGPPKGWWVEKGGPGGSCQHSGRQGKAAIMQLWKVTIVEETRLCGLKPYHINQRWCFSSLEAAVDQFLLDVD